MIKINLVRCGLRGGLPATLQLKETELLDLAFNDITGVVPSNLFTLPKLQSLLLSRNSLTGSIVFTTPINSRMKEIILGNNRLVGRIPESISVMTNLESLTVSYNSNRIDSLFNHMLSTSHFRV